MPSGPVSARRAPIYVRSRTQAAPRPPAAQMEISAVFLPFSSSSRSAWCTRRAPVAAKGWPRAMLPPRGFSFSSGTSPMGSAPPRCSSANFFELQAWRLESTCAAKASWISTRSMSLSFIPARLSAFGAENAGACRSCQPGSTAAYAYARRKPSGRSPSSRTRSSAQTTRAAARRQYGLGDRARVGDGNVAHRLRPTNDGEVDLAERDRVGGAGHRLQAGGAGPDHGVRVHILGQPRRQPHLAGDIGELHRGNHGPEHDLVDGLCGNLRPLAQLPDDLLSQLQRGEILERGVCFDEWGA